MSSLLPFSLSESFKTFTTMTKLFPCNDSPVSVSSDRLLLVTLLIFRRYSSFCFSSCSLACSQFSIFWRHSLEILFYEVFGSLTSGLRSKGKDVKFSIIFNFLSHSFDTNTKRKKPKIQIEIKPETQAPSWLIKMRNLQIITETMERKSN